MVDVHTGVDDVYHRTIALLQPRFGYMDAAMRIIMKIAARKRSNAW